MVQQHRIVNLILSVTISLVLTVPLYLIYSNLEDRAIDDIKMNAITIARITATVIENDIDAYSELYSVKEYHEANYDEGYYNYMLLKIRKIKEQTNARYIFTEKRIDNNKIAYILDSEPKSSKNFSQIGSLDVIDSSEKKAFDDNIATATDFIEDKQWGKYITGYAPIVAAETGDFLGLVGVDFSADYIHRHVSDLRNLFLVIYFLLVVVVIYLINNVLYRVQLRNSRDYLTGLHNRMSLDKNLVKAIKQHYNKPLSVAIIDIDSFKQINDAYGHIYGDKIIKHVAEHIVKLSRKSDIVTRFGGDEFVVIFHDTAVVDAKNICNRIVNQMPSLGGPYNDNSEMQRVTLSVGLAGGICYSQGCSDILENADKALYTAKAQGKNCCMVYNESQ